jgi:atypical dual specificity phosphatase
MQLDWIEPNTLAASSLPSSADDVKSLTDQGIRAIVTLTERPLTGVGGITGDLLRGLDILALHVPIPDMGAPHEAQVDEVVGFIDRMKAEGRAVLIHCKVGQGRTGTLLHAYYLAKDWNLYDAKNHVAIARPLCDFMHLSNPQRAFLEDYAAGRTLFV